MFKIVTATGLGRVWIHPETRTWHDKNIQLKIVLMIVIAIMINYNTDNNNNIRDENKNKIIK